MSSSVLTLRAVLGLDSSEYDDGLDKSSNKANSFADKLKNVFGAAAKATAVAFTAAAAGVAALTKAAVNSYAEYEQLVGGINKLFGEESAAIVAKYAEQAYLTSGKSINEYYNSVSQITATLKRSIGDDMEEVARVADVAMQVISDNINTFGSDTEFVENAIMGLSRQNYTMIDNLKLGYAGTAQGMLELINDSGILGRTLKDTSELATVGFDQMILAIQEVQKQQGIAGTTVAEAMRTIEGTAKATKSAWENVKTAIGRGEGLDEALTGLTTAIFGDGSPNTGLLAQIIPRVQTAMQGVADFIVKSAPIISEKIPEIVQAIAPSLISGGILLAATLGKGIISALPSVVRSISDVLGQISPQLQDIWDGLVGTFGWLIDHGEVIVGVIAAIAGGFMVYKTITGILQAVSTAQALLNVVMSANPIGLVAIAIGGLIAAFTALWTTSEGFRNFWFGLWEGIKSAVQSVGNFIAGIFNSIGGLITKIVDAFRNFDWKTVGTNLINGIKNGVTSAAKNLVNSVVDTARSAFNGVKKFLGIKSPSRLMRDQVGKFMALGIGEGFEDFFPIDDMIDAMQDAVDDISEVGVGGLANEAITTTTATTDNSSSVGVAGGITINVYGGDKDVSEIVDEVIDAIESNIMMTRRVYQ